MRDISVLFEDECPLSTDFSEPSGEGDRALSRVEAIIEYLGDLDLYAESGQTLEGSFSAVSKPNFASKYSLELGSRWKTLAEIYKMHP